jgi:hypothetical protein
MQPMRLRLIGTRNKDGHQYNFPTVHEVAPLIPGDGNPTDSRDVLIEERGTGVVDVFPNCTQVLWRCSIHCYFLTERMVSI